MTNKEAIDRITQNIGAALFHAALSHDEEVLQDTKLDVEAFKMAINALKQESFFHSLTKPNIEVLKEHHKVCDDCDGFIYDYCSECPIRNKNKDDDAS